MDRGEVLVAAHRLRRAAPRNADVLAVTDWVLGGGGKIEEDTDVKLVEFGERVANQWRAVVAERDVEIAALKAAPRGECSNCAEKVADLERVRATLRLQNKRNDDLYWEVEKLKGQVVVAGGGECPMCAERRAIDAARQRRKRERRQAKEA